MGTRQIIKATIIAVIAALKIVLLCYLALKTGLWYYQKKSNSMHV